MTSPRFLPAGSVAEGGDPVAISTRSERSAYTGLRVMSLAPGESRTFTTGTSEAAVLPLSGPCRVEVEGRSWDLKGREGVFSGISDFAYVPIDAELRITAAAPAEIALCSAEAGRRIDPYYVAASDVPVEVRGGGPAARQVNNFLAAHAHDAAAMIAVEVLTPGGCWSSYPSHKHDEDSDVEVALEEIYYFRIAGRGGTGFFSCYTADGEIDDTVTVRDGDVYLVPRGYHGPAAAAPGYHMYYLNVMAGTQAERRWRYTDDPVHAWVRDAMEQLEPDPRLPLTTAGDHPDRP